MILLIGPCENTNNKGNTGGIVVLFEDLLVWSDKNEILYEVIDTNKSNYGNKIKAFLMIFYFSVIKIIKAKHVSLHGTAKDYLYLAPFIIFLSRIFGKKISLRKFAGNFDSFYEGANPIKKNILKWVLKKSDILFFETKRLVKFGLLFNKKTYWLPNTRKKALDTIGERRFNKRFVFISQVKNTKGVIEILKAKKNLSSDYVIDIYGPIIEGELDLQGLESCFKKNYKGTLSSKDVQIKLKEYDVVLLPTYHEGEGYPGIILESFSLGKPVISTLWNSIDELVEDKYNGFLIPVRDYIELVNAMVKFNTDNFNKMSINALNSFNKFDRDINYEKYLDLLCSI